MAKIFSQLEGAQLELLTTAGEPAQGTTGRVWFNTDTAVARVDDGTVIKDVGTAATPTGAVLDWSGGAAPTGWLLCDGSAQLRASFPALDSLYSALSYPYGNGDGSTTFNLPDLRGRVSVGKDDMGGGAAGRVTVGESGITGTTLGDSGGVEAYQLTDAEMPSHDHGGNTLTGSAHSHNVQETGGASDMRLDNVTAGAGLAVSTSGGAGNNVDTAAESAHIHGISVAGSDDTHQNMPPALILNKIVKT